MNAGLSEQNSVGFVAIRMGYWRRMGNYTGQKQNITVNFSTCKSPSVSCKISDLRC